MTVMVFLVGLLIGLTAGALGALWYIVFADDQW